MPGSLRFASTGIPLVRWCHGFHCSVLLGLLIQCIKVCFVNPPDGFNRAWRLVQRVDRLPDLATDAALVGAFVRCVGTEHQARRMTQPWAVSFQVDSVSLWSGTHDGGACVDDVPLVDLRGIDT